MNGVVKVELRADVVDGGQVSTPLLALFLSLMPWPSVNFKNKVLAAFTLTVCTFLCTTELQHALHIKILLNYSSTFKLVYNEHPLDLEFVAVVDRWSMFRGTSMLCRLKL